MIINSLKISNFQCFFGQLEANKFTFTRGMNLVIANNGNGKSKLFDAFYWVLNDKVFHTGKRKFVSSAEYEDRLVNDRAKKQANVGDNITTEVVLNAESSNGALVEIRRKLITKKTSDKDFKILGPSQLIIREKKPRQQWQMKAEIDHEAILSRLVPKHVRDFMWFQGEAIDTLMDFTDKAKLKAVIDLLSNLRGFEEMIQVAQKASNKAERALRSSMSKNNKNKIQAEELQSKIERDEHRIKLLLSELEKYQLEKERSSEYIDQLVNVIENANNANKIKSKLAEIDAKIHDIDKNISHAYNTIHKKIFSRNWICEGTEDVLNIFEEMYGKYESKHNQIIQSKTKVVIELPANIPQPAQVYKMLEKEKCFVCGREAKKGTSEYKHIKSLVNRKAINAEKIFNVDLMNDLNKLYKVGLEYRGILRNIKNDKTEQIERIYELENEKKMLSHKKEQLEKELTDVLVEGDSEEIAKSYKIHTERNQNAIRRISEIKAEIENLKRCIQERSKELANNVVGEIDKSLVLSKETFEMLAKLTIEAKDYMYEKFIGKILKLIEI